MMTIEEKRERTEARTAARQAAKEAARIESERGQRPVDTIAISIVWSKSRMWGSNPHAEVVVEYKDGHYTRKSGYTASGCGYDKESTVIADIFNDFLRYKLWAMPIDKVKRVNGGPAPYGISVNGEDYRGYSGGIGTNCYYRIAEYVGGTFEHVASGKSFDVYRYTDRT
jgi:hypothetical protein